MRVARGLATPHKIWSNRLAPAVSGLQRFVSLRAWAVFPSPTVGRSIPDGEIFWSEETLRISGFDVRLLDKGRNASGHNGPEQTGWSEQT